MAFGTLAQAIASVKRQAVKRQITPIGSELVKYLCRHLDTYPVELLIFVD